MINLKIKTRKEKRRTDKQVLFIISRKQLDEKSHFSSGPYLPLWCVDLYELQHHTRYIFFTMPLTEGEFYF